MWLIRVLIYLKYLAKSLTYIIKATLSLFSIKLKDNLNQVCFNQVGNHKLQSKNSVKVIMVLKMFVPAKIKILAQQRKEELRKSLSLILKSINKPDQLIEVLDSILLDKAKKIDPSMLKIKNNKDFSHNGHLGDIVYSLLAIKSLSEQKKIKVNYYIKNDVGNDILLKGHPSGGEFMISQKSFDFIEPLLVKQSYIQSSHFVESSKVDGIATDLSLFRSGYVNTSAGLITDWYSKAFGVQINLAKKWLTIDTKHAEYSNAIIIGRSTRYLNQSIDYSFLKHLDDVFFIGTTDEYKIFKKQFALTKLKYIKVRDALHAAEIIASCKCYIGNQSLFFSIAEGLKVPRALEVYEPAPNVIPLGDNCISYIFTTNLVDFICDRFNVNNINVKKMQPRYIHVLKR